MASFLLLYGRAGTPVVSMGDVVARALVITFFCQTCMYLLDLYNFRLSQTWGEMLFALAIAIGFVCVGIGLLSYAIPKFGVAGKMYYLSILIASVCLLLWRIAVRNVHYPVCDSREYPDRRNGGSGPAGRGGSEKE